MFPCGFHRYIHFYPIEKKAELKVLLEFYLFIFSFLFSFGYQNLFEILKLFKINFKSINSFFMSSIDLHY